MRSFNIQQSQRMWTAFKQQEIRKEQKKDKLQLSFNAWLKKTTPSFNWDWPYLVHIQKATEQLLNGDFDFLMICCPPRHGKTEQTTVRLPVYFLDQFSAKNVIVGSYNQTLANKFSRKSRRIARNCLNLNQERAAVEEWETIEGGAYRAVGVGSGITGQGGHLIIIDDPIKNREEANSLVYRDKVWDWFTDDLYTRLEPGGKMILIQCMTGETPVLMGDGSEKELQDIKIGDMVATFNNGKLEKSKVINHRSNHLDFTYSIKMTCGKIVHANERHPFLVEENGLLKWIRLKNLVTGHKIVILKDKRENGQGKNVTLKNVTKMLSVEDIACLITLKKCGQMGTVLRHIMESLIETRILNIDTELQSLSMMQWLNCKMVNVLFANNLQVIMCALIGVENYALTTATIPIRLEDFCAMIATSQWDMQNQKKQPLQLQNISDFTVDKIDKIEPFGMREVFDLQVENTENFIANGLVSHNTRWSADDLAGRILDSETAHKWRVVSLPALAEEGDELGRKVGEALCNDRYTRDNLLAIKKVIGRNFEALYQQRPSVLAGEIIEIDKLRLIKQMPAANEFDFILQSWDTAFKDKEENDYTVGTTWGIKNDGYYILDRWKNKAIYSVVKEEIHRCAYQYNPDVILIEDRASGQSIIQDLQQDRRLPVVAVKADKSKISRAQAVTSIVNNGMIYLQKDSVWLSDFLSNLAMFPNGAHDDDVDSFTMALNYITKRFANTLAVYQDYNDNLHLLRDDLKDINIVKIYVGIYIDTIASAVVIGITELQQVIILSEFISESGIETLLEDEIVPYLIKHYKKHSVDFTVRADRPDSAWIDVFDKYNIDYNDISRVDISYGLDIVKKMLTKIIRKMPQIQLHKFSTPLLREGFRGAYHYKNREDPHEINFTEKPVKNKYARLHIALQNSLYFYSDYVYSESSLRNEEEITAESGQNKVTGY